MTHFPKNLTENASREGKGKEATDDELMTKELTRMMKANYDNHHLNKYLTIEECWELFMLEGSSRGLAVEERVHRAQRRELLLEKVDYDELHAEAELDILKKQHAKNLKPESHAGYELGSREFTLTYSPDWFNDEKAQFFMKQAIERLSNYYQEEIVYFKAVGEKTKADRVHIHVYYELKKGLKITDKNLKRAYSKWDAKHHHHKLVKKSSDFLGYIEKDIKGSWFTKTIDNRAIQEGRGS